ncbi:MAG: hypothetical protein LBS00_08940 [Synergistaceae bacterium]|nr:hypothetical protein [Synergistaceae bacterium]
MLAAALMEYKFDLVSDGTDNHLMLVDLGNQCRQLNVNFAPVQKSIPFCTPLLRC